MRMYIHIYVYGIHTYIYMYIYRYRSDTCRWQQTAKPVVERLRSTSDDHDDDEEDEEDDDERLRSMSVDRDNEDDHDVKGDDADQDEVNMEMKRAEKDFLELRPVQLLPLGNLGQLSPVASSRLSTVDPLLPPPPFTTFCLSPFNPVRIM